MSQIFQDLSTQQFTDISIFPGTSWVVLAEPVPQGSIHRLKMKRGTIFQYILILLMSMCLLFLVALKLEIGCVNQDVFGRRKKTQDKEHMKL